MSGTPFECVQLVEEIIEFTELSEQGAAPAGAIPLRFPFLTASSVWTVNHGLGYQPGFEAMDIDGYILVGLSRHFDENQLIIEFSVPLTGYVSVFR